MGFGLRGVRREDHLETAISRLILKHSLEDWLQLTSCDAVVVGAGPAGMTAAWRLSELGFKTVIFERRLGFGGGIGGGGMLFHKILVEREAEELLKEMGARSKPSEDERFLVVDASELMAKLASKALDSGAKIINGVIVEDIIYRSNPLRISGAVVTWSAIKLAGLHVDPLFVESKALIDATGHDAEVLRIASRKIPELSLEISGEASADAEVGEKLVVEKTGRVAPGLYAAGMAVAALHRIPRMGPIFGGMLLSGEKVARVVASDLRKQG